MILKEKSFLCFLISIPLIMMIGMNKPALKDPRINNRIARDRFWVMKTHGTTVYDMILMGDSRTYRALSPANMESILDGYRIFNFGYSAGGLNPVMYKAAERRIDPQSTKKVIVLGITPRELTLDTTQNQKYLEDLNKPIDEVLMYQYFIPLVDFLNPISPEDLLDAINKSIKTEKSRNFPGYYQEYYDDGWVASWFIPENPEDSLQEYEDYFNINKVDPGVVEDLFEQTREWTSEGIKVFAFRVPTTEKMVALENETSGFNEPSFTDGFKNAGGIWFDIPLEPYHTYDGAHLVKPSAIRLSLDLAKLIKNYLDENP